MPRIDLVPEVLYEGEHPYHHHFDNRPLKNILFRQELINSAVDNVDEILRRGAGNQGDIANRINQSLNLDGSLRTTAVDDAGHSIESHSDTATYVRMLQTERDKLAEISTDATALTLQFETAGISNTAVDFDDEQVIVADSTSISWTWADGKVKAHTVFSESSAHQHYYDLEPVDADGSGGYINYKTTTVSTPFVEGSLRVYINGIRLSEDESIYVPGNLPTDSWTLMSFTSDAEDGIFSLSTAITAEDVIRIDFDVAQT